MTWHVAIPFFFIVFAMAVRAMYRLIKPALAQRRQKQRAEADHREKMRAMVSIPTQTGPKAQANPAIRAAVELAKQHWPEFVLAFEHRNPNQHFSAKGLFRTGSRIELMWLTVTAIENNIVFGILDNNPAKLKALHAGSKVKIELEDLYDWLIAVDHKIVSGGFTIQALHDAGNSPAM